MPTFQQQTRETRRKGMFYGVFPNPAPPHQTALPHFLTTLVTRPDKNGRKAKRRPGVGRLFVVSSSLHPVICAGAQVQLMTLCPRWRMQFI